MKCKNGHNFVACKCGHGMVQHRDQGETVTTTCDDERCRQTETQVLYPCKADNCDCKDFVGAA